VAACYATEVGLVSVTNPFATAGVFTASITELFDDDMKKLTASRMPLRKFSQPSGPASEPVSGRRAFWLETVQVTLGPHATVDVPVHFCPTRLGPHAATLLLSSPALGDVAVAVVARGELPEPLNVFSFRCVVPCAPCCWQIEVPFGNALREGALCSIPDALALSLQRAGPAPATFAVAAAGAESFQFADHVTLLPGKPSTTGTLFAPSLTKSTLVRPVMNTPLDFVFSAASVGQFTADVVLSAYDDVRLYRIQVDVSDGKVIDLPMTAAVLDVTMCDYIISNDSDQVWTIHARLSDAAGLRVPSCFTIEPHSSAAIPLAFGPLLPGTTEASLLLINTTIDLEQRFHVVAEAVLRHPAERVVVRGYAGEATQYTLVLPPLSEPTEFRVAVLDLPSVSTPETVALPGGAAPAGIALSIFSALPQQSTGFVYVCSTVLRHRCLF